MAYKALVVCFLVAACVGYGLALKCYQCATNCGDPFDFSQNTATECLATFNGCSKVKTEANGQTLIVRSCAILLNNGGCDTAGGVTSCQCSGDSCNSSVRVPYNSLMIFTLALLLAFVFVKKY